MEFGAASAIPERYGQILADEGLAGRLAYKMHLQSVDTGDARVMAAEFKSFLMELGQEGKLGALWGMRERAGGSDRKAAEAALVSGLEARGRRGELDALVEFIKTGGLTLKMGKAAENAALAAMDVCGVGGKVSLVVGLLGEDGLPESLYAKAIGVGGKGTYVDYAKYMEAAIGLAKCGWASPELKGNAENALVGWGVDGCLERADPDDTGQLLVLDEKGNTATERVDKGRLISIVLGLIGDAEVGEEVRIKAVKAAAACAHVGRAGLIEALGKVVDGGVAPGPLREVAEEALAVEELGEGHKEMMKEPEKHLEKLADSLRKVREGGKRSVKDAIVLGLKRCGENGDLEGPVELLGRDDMGRGLREAAEKAASEAVDVRRAGEGINDAVRALRKAGLSEGLQKKIICAADGDPHTEIIKFVDALRELLGKKISPGLRKAAENALEWAAGRCIEDYKEAEAQGRPGIEKKMKLGTVSLLLRNGGVPWKIVDMAVEACSKTVYFPSIANVFRKEGLPRRSAELAEMAMDESIDFFARRDSEEGGRQEGGMGLIAHLLWVKGLPASVYLKIIKACREAKNVHGYPFVDAMGEMFSTPGVAPEVKQAVEEALVGGELVRCGGAGYEERIERLGRMQNIPDKVREEIGHVLKACRKLRNRQREEAQAAKGPKPNTPVSLSGDQGFVDSRVKPPSSEKKAVAPSEGAPITRIVPANGRNPGS